MVVNSMTSVNGTNNCIDAFNYSERMKEKDKFKVSVKLNVPHVELTMQGIQIDTASIKKNTYWLDCVLFAHS